MSYLNPLRLHFAGQFQANVSTVNNDPGHYDNSTFLPSYQQMQTPGSNNGWFNPQGDAAWRLLGCKVTTAWMNDDTQVGPTDTVLSCIVADSDSQTCAKLVDLDPEQQMVSTIWGLQVRIADTNGNTLLRGDYKPAAFIDIWDRATGIGVAGDAGAGAIYQSVLQNLQWGDVSQSSFLLELQRGSTSGTLSIKFNVDGINMDFTSPQFMCGRIVGTIGPANSGEPNHFVLGRQFMANAGPISGNFFVPEGGINFFAGVVDSKSGAIFLDLGNAISTAVPGGSSNDYGDLILRVPSSVNPPWQVLGVVPSQGPTGYASNPNWYSQTAGVVRLPLTADQRALIAESPLSLIAGDGSKTFIGEEPAGRFVRADNYVYRLSPGEDAEIQTYVTQFGAVLPKEPVAFLYDASGLQPANYINQQKVPSVSTPLAALQFNSYDVSDANGVARLIVKTNDPGNPRGFIDGQVYGIRPVLINDPASSVSNPWNFISVLLWDKFSPSEPLTWYGDVGPIFQQYANLYPVMSRFLDMGNFDEVVEHRQMLLHVFGLDQSNPNTMPVTRDLSPAKRNAITRWLKDPLKGSPQAAAAAADALVSPAPEIEIAFRLPPPGGKAAAAARRLRVVLSRP